MEAQRQDAPVRLLIWWFCFTVSCVLTFSLLFSLVFCSELCEVLRLVLVCFCHNLSCLPWQIGEKVVFVLLQHARNPAQTLRTISPMLWDKKQTCWNFRGTFFLYMLQGELCIWHCGFLHDFSVQDCLTAVCHSIAGLWLALFLLYKY